MPLTITVLVAAIALAACTRSDEESGGSEASPAGTTRQVVASARRAAVVSPTLFGANTPWHDLGNHIVENGEQLRDRSFRRPQVYWHAVTRGEARAKFESAGGADVPQSDPACAQLEVSGADATAAMFQTVLGELLPGIHEVRFWSSATSGTPSLMIALVDESHAELAPPVIEPTANEGWKHHRVALRVPATRARAQLGLSSVSPGVVLIDEVRFVRAEGEPQVGAATRRLIRELGVRSLRWPGGSDLDTLDWRQTCGPLAERREQEVIYGGPQTPSFGLHEFLDLCEQEQLAPVIAMNVLDSAKSAADMLEYIRGDAESEQGRLRARNGRVAPWTTATRFEIGNEPAIKYAEPGKLASGGRHYARRAKAIAEELRRKSLDLGLEIEVSGAFEGAMQLAEWLGDRGESVVTMLDRWNAQCATEQLTSLVQAVHAHYYSYHGHVNDERSQFENLMAAGAVLSRTLEERIRPHSGDLPIWLTEYHALVSDDGKVQPSFSKDFASGLVVADILMTLVNEGVPVAHVHNLSEFGAFGLVFREGGGWRVRPAGLAFELMSAAAGQRTLDIRVSPIQAHEPVRIRGGVGNLPRRLTYPRITGFATAADDSRRARVFLLNRSFDLAIEVEVAVDGVDLGPGLATWYQSDEVTADNEGDDEPRVRLGTTELAASQTWRIELPPHSLVRIDPR
jgi:alpha-L-arabinofuranosidase